MVLRVEKIGDGLGVMIPAGALELREGVAVEIRQVEADSASSKYITADEAMESYLKTEPLHGNAYRELAK